MFPLKPHEIEIFDRIVDILAEEKCELGVAEEILARVVMRIRGTSLVQDSSHLNGLPRIKRKDTEETFNPFSELPYALEIGVDKCADNPLCYRADCGKRVVSRNG